MGASLGLKTLAVPLSLGQPSVLERGLSIVTRVDLRGENLGALKRQTNRVRKQAVIVSAPLGGVKATNWAAEDERVDLLTLADPSLGNSLRSTTARLAAGSETALEIPIRPLLTTIGLARSWVLKSIRESCRTAHEAGMPIVLSSGATQPIQLRSSRALRCVAHLLGLDERLAKTAVLQTPDEIVTNNLRRLETEYVAPGVELIKRGGES